MYALALNRPLPWLLQLPRRLLLWPTGLFQTSLADVTAAVRTHDLGALARYVSELAVNLAWWIALGVAGFLIWRTRGRPSNASAPEPWVIALVFAAGNLLLALLVLPTELRFGYLWFALAPAALFCALSRLRGAVALALVLSIALVVPQLHSLVVSLSSQSIEAYRLARGSARQLTELLGALPGHVTTVYLLDDMADQTSSPEYFAKLSGFRGRLILINNLVPILGCRASSQSAQQYRLTGSAGGGETLLEYHAPDCFQRAWNAPPLQLFDRDNSISRADMLTYHYPDLSTKGRKAGLAYELGRRFTVRSHDPACRKGGACVWLGFDPAAHRYYVLPFESAAPAQ